MPHARSQLGNNGERLAEEYLRAKGLRCIARQFGTPVGELDLVMREGDTIVFVEVKSRADRRWADPQDAVGREKQAKLRKAAEWFLHQKRWQDRPARLDVVAVITGGPQPEFEHFIDVG